MKFFVIGEIIIFYIPPFCIFRIPMRKVLDFAKKNLNVVSNTVVNWQRKILRKSKVFPTTYNSKIPIFHSNFNANSSQIL